MQQSIIYLISEHKDAVYKVEYLRDKIKVEGAHMKVGAIEEEFKLAAFEKWRQPLQLSNMKQYDRLSSVYLEN